MTFRANFEYVRRCTVLNLLRMSCRKIVHVWEWFKLVYHVLQDCRTREFWLELLMKSLMKYIGWFSTFIDTVLHVLGCLAGQKRSCKVILLWVHPTLQESKQCKILDLMFERWHIYAVSFLVARFCLIHTSTVFTVGWTAREGAYPEFFSKFINRENVGDFKGEQKFKKSFLWKHMMRCNQIAMFIF